MSFIDILRKIGILRYGAKSAVYHSAKDRPVEFMMDNVYNAEKETINLNKTSAPPPVPSTESGAKFCSRCGAALNTGAKFCASCGAPVAAPVASSAATPPARKRKGCLMGALIAAGIILAVLVLLAIIGSNTSPESKPAPTQAEEAAAPAPDQQQTAPPVVPASEPMAPARESPAPVAKPMAPPKPAKGYDRYVNPKFGFFTELPAHWESTVRNNTHLFSGPEGAEDNVVTINFQIINAADAGSLAQQKKDVLDQFRRMKGFVLVEDNDFQFQDRYPASFLHVAYEMPGDKTKWEQLQLIVARPPYFYYIAYTTPQPLFEKYKQYFKHLVDTLQFTPIKP